MNLPLQSSKLISLVNHLPATVYQCRNDRQWTMTYINENCWQLTGYEAGDFIENNRLNYNSLICREDQELVHSEIQAAIASHTEFNLEYRIVHQSQKTKWVWERGKGVYSPQGELLFLEGLIIDITEQKSIKDEEYLLLNLTKIVSSAVNFETAIVSTLQKICTIGNWEFGEAWLPDTENNSLTYFTAWFPILENYVSETNLSLADFKQLSFDYTFHYAEGLPGKVWAKKEAVWFRNLSQQELFLRRKLVEECGLKTAFGIPVLARGEVVSVLVFFSRQSLPKNQDFISLLQTVAYQLGHLFCHKQIETQLNESKQKLSSIFESNLGIFFRINYQAQNKSDYLTQGCQSLTGYTKKELLKDGKINFRKIIHPLDLQRVSSTIKTSLARNAYYYLEYRIFTKDNQEKWVWEKGKGVFDSQGKLSALEGIITDLSDRKSLEEALSQAEDRYRNFFDNAVEGIFQTTVEGHYLSVNKALVKIYGYDSPSQLIKCVNNIANNLYVQPQRRQEFTDLLKIEEAITGFESQVYRQDGKIIWICENARAVKNNQGDLLYYEGTVEDITNYKKAQRKLHRQAFYDQLTSLPNRRLLLKYLNRTLKKLKQGSNPNYQFGVLFLDCDRFKAVNDSLGHSIGDLLLVAIGERLKTCIQENNVLARLGGDEFTILVDDIEQIKDVIEIVENIKKAFRPPFAIKEHQLFCGVSIGIFFSSSIEPQEYNRLTAAEVLQCADTALYKAKSQRKTYYQIFQGDMHNEALANLQLENEIRQGLKENEFVLHYQPIVDLANNNHVKGFESLIRWNHPQLGFTTPNCFIGLAEDTGLIVPMTYWVLKEGCQQLKQWHDCILDNNLSPFILPTLNINLSCQEFSSENFLAKLDQIISQTQVNPEYLRLELTENSSIFQEDYVVEILNEVVHRKIQLWIDDFGTGYSNLSYLHRLPIQGLKVNRYFVKDIETNTTKAKMIKGILSLAEDLELEIVVEGIETQMQLQLIQQMGGRYAQGYFFSHPLSTLQAFDLLHK